MISVNSYESCNWHKTFVYVRSDCMHHGVLFLLARDCVSEIGVAMFCGKTAHNLKYEF